MPFIRLFTSKRCTLLTTSISLNKEIMSLYFYYIKKKLVYIIITDFFSCQPSSCIEYTKLNTYILYNMRLIFFNKYAFLYYTYYYVY